MTSLCRSCTRKLPIIYQLHMRLLKIIPLHHLHRRGQEHISKTLTRQKSLYSPILLCILLVILGPRRAHGDPFLEPTAGEYEVISK